jgi:hypothetical protein
VSDLPQLLHALLANIGKGIATRPSGNAATEDGLGRRARPSAVVIWPQSACGVLGGASRPGRSGAIEQSIETPPEAPPLRARLSALTGVVEMPSAFSSRPAPRGYARWWRTAHGGSWYERCDPHSPTLSKVF